MNSRPPSLTVSPITPHPLLRWAATAGFRIPTSPALVVSANATASPVQRLTIPSNRTEEQVTQVVSPVYNIIRCVVVSLVPGPSFFVAVTASDGKLGPGKEAMF